MKACQMDYVTWELWEKNTMLHCLTSRYYIGIKYSHNIT